MKLWRNTWLIALLLAVLASGQTVSAQGAPLGGFDEYVNKAIRDWEVPGIAIAIVKDDKIVFAKGYGVRKLGDSEPISERTLFALGSVSKAFTAASVAMLVDEGKLKWDDPVAKHLPGFELYDPYVTRELTVRDLLSHRSGLPGGDFIWYGTDLDREEVMCRVRYLKPSSSLRSRFGYNNLMFLAAGQIVARVSGKGWDEFIRDRIFTPLGMTASNTSIRYLDGNVASPHDEISGRLTVVPWRSLDNVAPAGSINSNVVEVAQWLLLQLGQGAFENGRLISAGAVKEMHRSQTVMRAESPFSLWHPDIHFVNYGLGWFLSDYKGRKVVEHVGSIDGMRAQVALIPEEKLGLVILANRGGTSLPTALSYKIFDVYLGSAPRDWSVEMLKKERSATGQEKAAEKKLEAERVKDTKPTHTLDNYAGTYRNDLYGEVTITHGNGKLNLRFGPSFTGDMEHWHYNTFRAQFPANALTADALATFSLNPQGKIENVTLNLMPDYPFKRGREPAAAVR